MTSEQKTRRGLLAAIVFVPIVLAGALFLPRWWEGRELKQAREIAGVGSRLQDGSMTDARKKIDPGQTAEQVEKAIGKASFTVGTEGVSRHDIWTYYYKDGTMTVNLTDGTVARVSTLYGTPRIPKKGGGF